MRKNDKAFTLIELLAIIVILAIIAVITVPIILNIIENSRKGAAVDSAYGYKDAVEKYYLTELSKDSDFEINGEYTIGTKGELVGKEGETPLTHSISLSGTIPSEGIISIENNAVKTACLVVNEYKVELKDEKFITSGKGSCGVISDIPSDEPTGPDTQDPEPQTYTGEIYRNSEEMVSINVSIEGIDYTKNLSEISQNYYLKHQVENNVITKSYACVKDGGNELACVQGGVAGEEIYSANKVKLQILESKGWICYFYDSNSDCNDSSYYLSVNSDGNVSAIGDAVYCDVNSDGSSICG